MRFWISFSAEDRARLLLLPVSHLGLSARAHTALNRLGVSLVSDLVAQTETELLKTKGLGRSTLKEIKERLAEADLSLTHPVEKQTVRRIAAWLRHESAHSARTNNPNWAEAEASAADAIERGDWRKP